MKDKKLKSIIVDKTKINTNIHNQDNQDKPGNNQVENI